MPICAVWGGPGPIRCMSFHKPDRLLGGEKKMLLPVFVSDLELGREQHPIAESSILELRLHWDKCGSLPGDFNTEDGKVNL